MNYHQHIIEGLNEWVGIVVNRQRQAKIDMLTHFIKLMGEEQFNIVYKMYFIDYDEFDHAFHDFHKSMRNSDFYDLGEGSGHIDMLFWNFIHATNIPYKVLKVFTEKIKIGVIDDMDDVEFDAKGWNKFGFFQIRRK